ncbi:MAG: primosomal protein N', partial [Microcystaceae cyanobacterium]
MVVQTEETLVKFDPTLAKISEAAIAAPQPVQQWLLVLVDCPNNQGLYTYKVPEHLEIQIGDIISVPFGKQLLRGIAVSFTNSLPADLTAEQIREVEEVVLQGFFSPTFWPLLHRVADYYCCPL